MTYGPVDFLALEFETEKLKGEILPEILDLVEKKIVRVIDLVVIQKDQHGNHQALEMQQLAPEMMSVFDPLDVEISGIIQVEDIDAIAEAMEKNTIAAVLLVENLWAIKFGEAVVRANGRMLAHDRIPFDVINEVMETFAQAEAGD
jgi:hypothetical protein